ncbi:MAG: hypothetical protein ACKOXI_02820 [Candidatus Planktophila sp.]
MPLILAFALVAPAIAHAVDYTVTTAAGGGATGCGITAASGSTISVSNPWGITADRQGNVYYTDTARHAICKIDSSGLITRIAGTGSLGLGTDNVQGTSSTVSNPYNIAADSAGNVYVPEYYSSTAAIRKISTSGVITTIFNTGHSTTYAGDGGLATAAGGSSPLGIGVAPTGEVYFTNYGDYRLRKIDTSGVITRIAGDGGGTYSGNGSLASSASIGYVSGIAVTSRGDLLLASYSYCVRKIDAITGVISQFAGSCSVSGHTGDGGLATSATFLNLWGIAVDGADNVYLAERGGQTIRKVDAATGIVTTIVGIHGSSGSNNGTTATATIGSPYSVTIAANGDMYIADFGNNLIRKVAGIGVPFTSSTATLTFNSIVKFNTASNLQITGGQAGRVTFYANGKRIPSCISLVHSGNTTCAWKPASHSTSTIYAVINASGVFTKSNVLNLSSSARTNNR